MSASTDRQHPERWIVERVPGPASSAPAVGGPVGPGPDVRSSRVVATLQLGGHRQTFLAPSRLAMWEQLARYFGARTTALDAVTADIVTRDVARHAWSRAVRIWMEDAASWARDAGLTIHEVGDGGTQRVAAFGAPLADGSSTPPGRMPGVSLGG